MDVRQEVLDRLTYGLYVVTSRLDGKMNGQISDALMQVTAVPPKVAVSLCKKELTHDYVDRSGVLAVSVLAQSTPMPFIGLFGFRSGRDVDKLAHVSHRIGTSGCPLVLENATAVFEGRVIERVDLDTHTIFIADVTQAEVIRREPPLTYAYYTRHMRGKVPANAPTYHGETEAVAYDGDVADAKTYVCDVCGYVYDPSKGDPDHGVPAGTSFDELPDDWVCPVCGVGKDRFSPAA